MRTAPATLLAASLLALSALPAAASPVAPDGAPAPTTQLSLKAERHVPPALAASIVGTWNLFYSWNCTGDYAASTVTFNDDGTFNTGGGYTGTWKQRDIKVKWVFTSGTTYKGRQKSDNLLKGKMVSYTGLTGCWATTR